MVVRMATGEVDTAMRSEVDKRWLVGASFGSVSRSFCRLSIRWGGRWDPPPPTHPTIRSDTASPNNDGGGGLLVLYHVPEDVNL